MNFKLVGIYYDETDHHFRISKFDSNSILDIDKADEDSNPKIFFTSDSERHIEEVFINIIPSKRHKEFDCVAAKRKELSRNMMFMT